VLTRTATVDLLRRHGLKPRTTLGQHFLVDPNTIRKIVRLAGVRAGDTVLEIGAGLGALTLGLAETGADVIAVEHDRGLAGPLGEATAGRENVRIVWGDAMRLDLRSLIKNRAVMVSNLPYNIATPLVVELLAKAPAIERYLIMVQREVGMRLVAKAGAPDYGGVSVKVAYIAEPKLVSRISRKVFLPEPAVESVLVELRRRAQPPVDISRARLFNFVDAAFAQRRKTLRNALRSAGVDPTQTEKALARAGIPAGARAEELSLEELARVAARLPSLAVRR
jgi:16S rRNA (adenine1518-N6/adenine1519-N6)-dimethyltransferase